MKERQLLLPGRSSATGQRLWLMNTKSSLFLSYLREGLAKLHHQLPFASFFVFSFLTLDKTCQGEKKAGFQNNSTRTRQRRLLGSLHQDSEDTHPPLLSVGATALLRSQARWRFCFGSADGHLPTRYNYF